MNPFLLRAILYIFVLLPFNSIRAEFSLHLVSEKTVLRPGSIHTLIVLLENGNAPIDISRVDIKAPDQWKLITKRVPEKLEASGSAKIFMTFSLSNATPAGIALLPIDIYTQQGLLLHESFSFTVEDLHDISLEAIESPNQIIGSLPYQCTYLISNNGNLSETIKLYTRSGILSDTTILLDPASSQKITIEGSASEDYARPTTVVVDLQAELAGVDTMYSKNVPIPFFPTKTPKIDKYLRFPITVNASSFYFSARNTSFLTGRYSIQGNGFLDRNQNLRLGFTAMGPNQFQQPRFGQYDQYTLNLSYNSLFDLTVGDLGISISPLTEFSRFGRGIRYDQALGKFKIGGYYIKPRFFPESTKILGISSAYQVTDQINVQANLTKKDLALEPGQPDVFVNSLLVEYQGPALSISTEAARSDLQNQSAYATQTLLSYSDNSFHANGELLYADRDFRGYYTNTILLAANLRKNISEKVQVFVAGTRNESTPLQDTTVRFLTPKSLYYSAGVNLEINNEQDVSFQLLRSRKKDRILPVDFDYADNLLQMDYRFQDRKHEINWQTSYGVTENFRIQSGDREDQKGNSLRSNLFYAYQLKDRFTVGGSLEFYNTNKFTDQKINQKLLFYGATIRYYGRDLNVSINYQSNFPVDELYRQRSFLDGDVSYSISEHTRITATAGYAIFPGSTNFKQFYGTARVSQSINVPIKKILDLGSLQGKVIGNNGEKISGIRLSIADQQVITDLNGDFTFNDLPPGQYLLNIDNNSLAMNEVTREVGPIMVDIIPQQIAQRELEIVTCGAITGKINFKKEAAVQSKAFIKDMPKIYLKLQNENTSLFTEVGEDGKFTFLGLRPGEWKLTVLDQGWKKDYEISASERNINIQPAKKSQVEFELKPKSRQMKVSKKVFNLKTG